MAGYNNYSKSNNAIAAENEGKLPLTHAVKAVAKIAACTHTEARKALREVGPCEWHHTSKKYNKTDYYDVTAAVRYISGMQAMATLPDNWREAFEVALEIPHDTPGRMRMIKAAHQELSQKWGIALNTLECAYYNCWDEE